MNLWFLPYVREGFRPSSDGASASVAWRAQASVNTRVGAGGRPPHDATTHFDLLGPGDVVGIDPAQVLRLSPARDTNRAEPEFFPCVELDSPDLPWAYSPATPDADRMLPWLALIVVEDQLGVNVRPGGQGQSPWILRLDPAVAAHELPDLTESWAWAHAQVTCETQAQIVDTLADQPDRTLARLLSPRRLVPQRRYIACVVPTYLAGRIAGLAGDPEASAAQVARNLAWSSSDVPTELPVYLTWSFTTGEAGDVESMVRRIKAAPVSGGQRALNLRVASGDAPVVVDWQPPIRVPQQATADPRPPVIVDAIHAALAPSPGDGPVVGPPYLGEPWVAGRVFDPITSWVPALNLTPMARAAAGLGAAVVRARQEELVAAVWEQFMAHREADLHQRSQQLSTIVENQVKGRLQAAPIEQASRVLGPVVAQDAPDAPSVGLRTAVGRRATNKIWRIRQRTVNDVDLGVQVAPEPRAGLPAPPAVGALARLSPTFRPAATGAPADSTSEIGGTPPPMADTQTLLAQADPTYQGGRFAPRLPAALAEVLVQRSGGLLLPSTAQVLPDSLLAVEVDHSFVEAFLVGANQELNRELLWRGLPADPRATAFRRFWNHTDQGDDIPAIADWPATTALGGNSAPMDAGVLLRSEIVHRCPSLVVAAVPAVWGADGRRRPSSDAGAVTMPVIRTLVGDDLLYVGFAGLSLAGMIGQENPSGPAGWFILLAENPVDPRFGLDPPTTPPPTPARGDLSWSNVQMDAGEVYARATNLPAIPGVGFSPTTANGANVAYVLQQRTFRAFLHAAALAGAEG